MATTKTTKATAKKASTRTKTVKKAQKKTSSGLHYDKEALLEEYENTFPIAMKFLIIVVGAGILYFFLMATYLGKEGHTDHKPYVETFAGEDGRIETDYSGLKLPMDGGPTKEEFAAEKMAEHAHSPKTGTTESAAH